MTSVVVRTGSAHFSRRVATQNDGKVLLPAILFKDDKSL